nr:MAG TPA: polyVal ADP-ribosyltransferase [Caudoviricetes sp.]
MAKKKRTGLDALQEYEAGSGYAASSATSYGQTQTQGKTTTFKRSGLDALREYEQYKNPGAVQDTAFDPNYRSRNYQTPGQNAAFEAYKNAVNATQKTRNGVAVSGKVSEQEYSRSPGMQKQYGTYQNYLRGVEAAQGLKLGTLALQGQSALLAGRFAPATQQVREDVDAQNRRAKAAQTAQRDQVRGMRRTSQELGKQIEALEIEQADTHFSGTGLSENGKSVTQLQNEIENLQAQKTAVDNQSVLARAQEAIGNLSKEDQNLLRQYRGQELNGYQVRAYAKYDAKTALNEKGYSDDTLKRLAEWQKVLDDYDNAQKLDQAAQEMGSGSFAGKAAATLFSAALAPGKALGNLESLRGVLPKWAGGYQNEDMPTNIYSPAYNASRLSSGIRQSVMQNMNPTGQFLYQAGTSALDSAVNMAVSTGLVGTVGGAAGAGAKDAIAETMNWVMGSQVAADSVYEGIQNGKSNADALVDGIVEGAIEGITEKYSVGDIIENMLSGKAVWRKALRSFASEGAEEIASNWLNRAYDVVAKHDRGEVMTAYANYIAEGRTPAQALAAMVGDFAKEDSLSFLAGGLSGLAMSGTYAGVNRVILEANVTQTARAVIEAGEVQDVIDYGMAQEEGTKAHQLAEELQQTVDDGGEVTQKAVENTLREVAKEQQAAVDEGQEPRVPETLTRLEQLQEQARQEQAQAEADEKTFQIYKSAAETAQENQRLEQQYQQEQEQEQSRAQQSVQAVQQAQQAAQRQYDQDSLFAPIPGTENMGELDPVQYAQRQTADAEQALDEAALQQEEQYLQTQAQRAGYDEQTAAYFLNGNTTGMPAEQYAQSFGQVYEQGRLGASEQRAMRYAEGMNQDVAAAAYRAGLAAGQKGEGNGSIEVTDEGQVGQAGQRAEGQAGGVRQSTAQQQRADAGRKRAQGARDLAKAWDEVELSTLGFGKDNTQKVRVMPKGQEARSEDIQAAEKFFRSMGVQNARFFTGQLTQEIDGQTFYADAAVTEDGSVLIRADSEEYSAFELAKHEGYHLLVKRWPEMAAKIQKRLLGEGKITKEMIESYVDAYAGIYGDDTDAYVEEIIADTYAGMNRTDYGTNKLRADVKMEVGQWQKKSGSARAPPVKMSASKAEKYDFTKPFAEQVDDWKAGKIEKNDTLVVGSTPEVFQKVGFNALPVTINQTHVDYAINGTKDEEHHIGEPMLKQLPRAMKSPVAIIASESQRGTSVVALLPFIKDAKSVIIPVYIDGLGRQNSIVIDSNAVTSIYEKKNAVTGLLTNAIEKSNNGKTTLFYVDKVKAAALYQVARVPMPKMPDTDNGFVTSIRDEGSTVKPKLNNVTQSQQFKRWFGDWKNHPESASKVVNADGTPKVVYHGTNAKFNTFQQENGAYFFSESRDYAESMADERRGNRIIEAYLKMKNPYTVKLSPKQFTDNIAEAPSIRYAKEHGHDGVIFEYDGSKEDLAYDKFYVVFDSAQIKSATDNIGTFDKTNPDIRYSSQDGRYRDLMGEKAAQYTRRAENFLLSRIAGSFGVSPEAKRETLQPFTEQIVRKFLQTGELDNKLVGDLVDAAVEVSMEENQSYYEEYKGVLKFIENQKISIPAQDKEDIRYWNQFRQQAAKSMQIRDDGMPVRDVYWTLHKKAPQLFPASNKTAGAQIMQIYKVAEGIRQTREWIEGYKGVDAAEVSKVKQNVFEARATNARLDWAKNDARNAVKEFAADLRVTQRYLDRQKKAKDLLGLAIPQSAEEALELSKEVKKLRGRVQYVMNKNLLTAEDQKIVGALLRGDISEEAVRKMKNSKGILDVYEAKAAYDARMLTLRAWRVQNKQRMLDEVDADLDAAKFDQWADKGSGWGYDTETPERNFADVMRKIPGGDVLAKEFNNKYIYKIKQNESERKNFILEIQERVKKLDISEKVMRGNADSEAYAVQLLGEAQENAEMLKGQDAEEKKDGKTYEEWLAVIQKLKADNPNMDFAKIDKAITEFHKIYDELLDMINQVRVQFGYDPVSYRRGYFPHFTENEESILARFGRELGFTGTVSPLPTTINGLTSRFRPGIRYFKNANERLGYATAYNAIKGLDLYLDTASDVIFHTEDVQRMRALETQIRYRASDEGIRQQMDAIKANNTLDPDKQQQLIDELSKNGRTRMSHMAAWLTEYTNVLAGKRTGADRWLEEHIPQKIYNFARKAQQRVGANMVAANIGSAVTNFIPLTQAWAQTSTVNMMKGMWYTLANYVQADGLDQQSVFINNRSGYHGLSQSSMDKASEIAGWVMEKIDGFTTGSIVRARVIENMQRGMSQQSALEEADQFASGIMADRSKGATPLMYTVRSPIVKMFTQFQLEVNNELSWIFKDMAREERKKGVAALAKAMFKFLIGAWLYNEAAEAILGRRPALDPLDMLNDTVGDVSGYKVPNTWQAMAEYGVNPKNWDYTTEKKTPEEVWKGFASRVVDELPNTQLLAMFGLDEWMGLDLQGNRIAVISAFPDMEKVNKALLSSKEDMATKKKAQVLVDELSKPLSYAALPMGGGQARKSLQGIMSVVNGGKYKLNNEGEQQLQYPTYTDRPGDVPLKLAQGVLFGRTATQEAQDWIENGFKSLSVKETKAYQAITESGEDQRKTYTFVQAIKNVEKEYDKKMLLKSYSISDTAKTAYFYQVFANEDQQKEMDKLDEQGKIDFMKKYLAEAEDNHNRDELRDAAVAGTVTQEKAIQRMVANDWAKNEDDAYWKYREWIRKADDKDYKMYDDFLNAIEAGGDVKEAAKEYLEHGKEAKDLSREVTTAYKAQYLAATPEERRKLKQKLLEIYAALGFNRKEKSKDIDKWVKDAAKEKKDK